jgi:hypothetical protein
MVRLGFYRLNGNPVANYVLEETALDSFNLMPTIDAAIASGIQSSDRRVRLSSDAGSIYLPFAAFEWLCNRAVPPTQVDLAQAVAQSLRHGDGGDIIQAA